MPILGICGGYQMLGLTIRDPHRSESDRGEVNGLACSIETTFATTKRTVRVRGELLASMGPLAGARGSQIVAYEIWAAPRRTIAIQPLVAIEERSEALVSELDGGVYGDGLVMGTYLHGLLENDAPRHALIDWLQARRRASVQARPTAPNPYAEASPPTASASWSASPRPCAPRSTLRPCSQRAVWADCTGCCRLVGGTVVQSFCFQPESTRLDRTRL